MNSTVLQSAADGFLRVTCPVYDECSSGIERVKRIAVNVSSPLADDARAFLLPSVYGYWERFFRMTLVEFVGAFAACGLTALSVSPLIAKVALKEQINLAFEAAKIKQLSELPSAADAARAHSFFAVMEQWFASPFRLAKPDVHVNTTVNVRYEVLAANLAQWGVEIERLKIRVEDANLTLHPDLKLLVDRRNDIAHGNTFSPCTEREWTRMTDLVLVLMDVLQQELYEFLRDPARVMK